MNNVKVVPFETFAKARRFSERMLALRQVPKGALELTFRCNLDCQHCYVNLPANDRQAKAEELSFEEIRRIIDEAADEGLQFLNVTGGEVFIRPDFKEIYLYIKKKGIFPILYTNATMITERIADFFAEWPPYRIEITLYGATEETYEKITGVRGSYARCLRGIRLLYERKLPLKLKTVVMTLNKHELPQMEGIAESFGCRLKFAYHIIPRVVRGSKDPLKVRLSAEEGFELEQERGMQLDRDASTCSDCPSGDAQKQRTETLYTHCGAGREVFNIDPSGKLTACGLSRKRPYDLREGTFKEGWHDFLPKTLAIRKLPSVCDGCNIRHLCANTKCTGHRELETGILDGGLVPFLCEDAHLRAKALGLQANTPIIRSFDEWEATHEEEGQERIAGEASEVSETYAHQAGGGS